jgi:hypothetical protein
MEQDAQLHRSIFPAHRPLIKGAVREPSPASIQSGVRHLPNAAPRASEQECEAGPLNPHFVAQK